MISIAEREKQPEVTSNEMKITELQNLYSHRQQSRKVQQLK